MCLSLNSNVSKNFDLKSLSESFGTSRTKPAWRAYMQNQMYTALSVFIHARSQQEGQSIVSCRCVQQSRRIIMKGPKRDFKSPDPSLCVFDHVDVLVTYTLYATWSVLQNLYHWHCRILTYHYIEHSMLKHMCLSIEWIPMSSTKRLSAKNLPLL